MSKMVGMQLRQARQERGLTLEEAAQFTRIKVYYLRLLEAGEFSALPSKAQSRGFLRSYASYLELDPNELLASLEQDDLPPAGASVPTDKPGIPPTNQQEKKPEESAPSKAREEIAPTIRITENKPLQFREEQHSSQLRFIEIGQQLKGQRELLGLTFEEIERHTRLRKHYLQALEDGDLQGLPSPVQGRGMLNNYAEFLGLDPEPVLLKFAAGLQEELAIRKAVSQPTNKSRAQRKPSRPHRTLSGDLVIGGVMVIFMLAFVLWGGIRILTARTESQEINSTAPSIAEVLLASPTATMSPTPEPVTVGPPPTLTLPAIAVVTDSASGELLNTAGQGNVQIHLTVQQRTWLRVLVDGKVEFDGRVTPGSALTFVGDEMVEILTGNGQALQVIYNQQDLGILGEYGEVVNLIFTAEGVLEPTPTITFTSTQTQLLPELPTQTPSPAPVQGTNTPAAGTPPLP